MSQILTIQLKELFRNTKTILAYKLLRKHLTVTKHFHLTLLDTKKVANSNDILTKIVKANADLFSIFVSHAFNESVISYKFLCFEIG